MKKIYFSFFVGLLCFMPWYYSSAVQYCGNVYTYLENNKQIEENMMYRFDYNNEKDYMAQVISLTEKNNTCYDISDRQLSDEEKNSVPDFTIYKLNNKILSDEEIQKNWIQWYDKNWIYLGALYSSVKGLDCSIINQKAEEIKKLHAEWITTESFREFERKKSTAKWSEGEIPAEEAKEAELAFLKSYGIDFGKKINNHCFVTPISMDSISMDRDCRDRSLQIFTINYKQKILNSAQYCANIYLKNVPSAYTEYYSCDEHEIKIDLKKKTVEYAKLVKKSNGDGVTIPSVTNYDSEKLPKIVLDPLQTLLVSLAAVLAGLGVFLVIKMIRRKR